MYVTYVRDKKIVVPTNNVAIKIGKSYKYEMCLVSTYYVVTVRANIIHIL